MSEKKIIDQGYFEGERALFQEHDATIKRCVFDNGESPLKHSAHLDIYDTIFRYKYPLWYANDIYVEHCTWGEIGRAGVWYTNHMTVKDSIIEAPKNFRRCDDLTLDHVTFSDAKETVWNCKNVTMKDVTVKGDYFAMNLEHAMIDHLNLIGNYGFDGAKNIEIHNSTLLTKDAFWNCDNITIYDSKIIGEYLAWNSKHIHFVNCIIESLQGLCYVEDLKMEHCQMFNTTLAFEYSTHIDATIESEIDSVLNPSSGIIRSYGIRNLTLDSKQMDINAVKIETIKK